MVSRRALLRGLGASVAVGVAGCNAVFSGTDGSDDPTQSDKTDARSMPTTTPTHTFTVPRSPSDAGSQTTASTPTRTHTSTRSPTPAATATEVVSEMAGTAVFTDRSGQQWGAFGTAVALSDNVAMISGAGGAVEVFDSVRDGWTHTKVFTSKWTLDGSIALAGDSAVVGAPDADPSGRAYVFGPDRLGWPQRTKLSPARDVPERYPFGKSVAFDGETLVVGATYDGSPEKPDTGSAFVFDGSGDEWSQRTELGTDAQGLFGTSVAVSGDAILVGAPRTDVDRTSTYGVASIYERSDGTWNEQATVTGPDPSSQYDFGAAVALDGVTAVVCGHSPPVSVFERVESAGTETTRSTSGTDGGGGDGDWVQQARLRPNTESEERFGASIALDGEFAVVGSPMSDWSDTEAAGRAYVYRRDDWRLERILAPADPPEDMTFGVAVALHEDTVLVGAPMDDVTGRAYLFDL